MPTYNAGEARALYLLQADQALKVQGQIIQNYRTIAQLEARRPAAGASGQVTAEQVKLANALARTAQAEARKAAETRKAAEEDRKAAESSAKAAVSEQRRQTELAKTAREEARAAQSALSLQRARERAARSGENGGLGPALPRTFAGFTAGGLAQAAGALGLATIGPQVVGQAVGAGVEAGREALALQRTLSLTRALSGDQRTYNQVIAAARQQQLLYGGSLRETVAALSGLTIQSRSSGAELGTLIDLSQRLAVLDPAQGLEGAQIALREALSGDTRSLALRFEIPRAALVKLKDATIPVNERLAVLNDYLNQVGISSKTVGETVSEQARAYNKLGQEIGDLTTNTGAALADTLEGAATGLGRLIGLVNSNPQAIAELKAILGGRGSVSGADVQAEIDQRAAAERATRNRRAQVEVAPIADAGLQRAIVGGGIETTPDQTRIRELKARYAELRPALITLASASDEARASAQALAEEFGRTGDYERFASQLSILYAQQQSANAAIPQYIQAVTGARTATDQTAEALRGLSTEQAKTFSEQIDAARASDQLARLQAQLSQDLKLAAQGMLGNGDQALILAEKYGIAADAAQYLINKEQELSNRQALSDQRAGERSGGAVRTEREAEAAYRAGRLQAERGREAEAARRDQIRATGTEAQKAALAQQEYNEAVAAYGANSAEAIRAETALRQARGAGRTAGRGITADDRADLKLLADDQARLAALQAELARETNQESLKAKQIKGEILDLERKIATEQERQNQAAIDAQLGAVRDEQARMKEARETAANNRIIAGAQFSDEQKRAAELRNQEIALEQAKRASDIAKDQRAAGGAAITQPLPLPSVATLPPSVPAGPVPAGTAATAAAGASGAPPVALTIDITIQDGAVTSVNAGGVPLEVLINGSRATPTAGG